MARVHSGVGIARRRHLWGKTKEEALRNIQEIAQMVIEEMLEDGEAIPRSIRVSEEPVVAVTL